MPKKWYFTASLSVHTLPLYDQILSHIRDHLPGIAMERGDTEGYEVISARGMYRSGKDWIEKWPSVRQIIDGGLFFTVDDTFHIGKGVYTEVSDILKRQLPVYLVAHNGAFYPIISLVGPEYFDGPDYTYYLSINVKILEQRFKDLEAIEDMQDMLTVRDNLLD